MSAVHAHHGHGAGHDDGHHPNLPRGLNLVLAIILGFVAKSIGV